MSVIIFFGIVIAVAVAAIVAPTFFAIELARMQGQKQARNHLLDYANDIVIRSDATADQIFRGVQKLEQVISDLPCSNESLSIMQAIDLSSSYIQAIGYVFEDNLLCSSFGIEAGAAPLGPVSITTPRGLKMRTNVHFDFAPDAAFTVIQLHDYAAVVHRNLAVDITVHENNVSLASFVPSDSSPVIWASRGWIKPEWATRLGSQDQTTFIDGDYIVAITRSKQYRIAGLAAMPTSWVDEQVSEISTELIPVGLGAGVVLALIVFFLARRQMDMPNAIKAGLKRQQFYLEYQPVINLDTGACIGAEALVRWRMPDGTTVRPDLFIPIAENCGLIEQLTARVIHLVEQEALTLLRQYPDFHIAINLSASDFHSNRIIESLEQLASKGGKESSNLIVEITERGFLEAELAREILVKIRAAGIPVAIDDFGTGYSSLSYLQTFALDFLKIDKSFVDTIGTDAATSQVVVHIIEMAKALNLRIIAEGVETESQAQFLRERGVHYAQGWLFGKPGSLDDIIAKYPLGESTTPRKS